MFSIYLLCGGDTCLSHSSLIFLCHLPLSQAPKAQFGSTSPSLCHTLICLVSEQICPGVTQCKMQCRLCKKVRNSWLHSVQLQLTHSLLIIYGLHFAVAFTFKLLYILCELPVEKSNQWEENKLYQWRSTDFSSYTTPNRSGTCNSQCTWFCYSSATYVIITHLHDSGWLPSKQFR